MENPEEITQAIDLAALRGEVQRRPKRKKIDLYEVAADSIAADSLIGLVRKHNEDCFACCTKPDGHLALAAVADGIGGSEKGEVASSACRDYAGRKLQCYVNRSPENWIIPGEQVLFGHKVRTDGQLVIEPMGLCITEA